MAKQIPGDLIEYGDTTDPMQFLDGKQWMFVQGVDFDCGVKGIQMALYRAAEKKGVALATKRTTDEEGRPAVLFQVKKEVSKRMNRVPVAQAKPAPENRPLQLPPPQNATAEATFDQNESP